MHNKPGTSFLDYAKFYLYDSSIYLYFIKRINTFSISVILRTMFILKHFDVWQTYDAQLFPCIDVVCSLFDVDR